MLTREKNGALVGDNGLRDDNLQDSSDNTSQHLHRERDTRRELHVLAELEVCASIQTWRAVQTGEIEKVTDLHTSQRPGHQW